MGGRVGGTSIDRRHASRRALDHRWRRPGRRPRRLPNRARQTRGRRDRGDAARARGLSDPARAKHGPPVTARPMDRRPHGLLPARARPPRPADLRAPLAAPPDAHQRGHPPTPPRRSHQARRCRIRSRRPPRDRAMSDPDASIIEQLQAKRSRPRREPPTRRPARTAPAPPTVAAVAPNTAAISSPSQLDAKPAAATRTDEKQAMGAAGTAPTAVTSASAEEALALPTGTESASDRSDVGDRGGGGPLPLVADEPTANYAVRVRRSLDDLVAWRLAELRRHGVRASKVELTEMLLWELADADLEQIVTRIERFRAHAPR